jgi:hypothetical protein
MLSSRRDRATPVRLWFALDPPLNAGQGRTDGRQRATWPRPTSCRGRPRRLTGAPPDTPATRAHGPTRNVPRADACVPPSRVSEWLQARPEPFSASTEEMDARLSAEIRQHDMQRGCMSRLTVGHSLAPLTEVVDCLPPREELGLTRGLRQMGHDGCLLLDAPTKERGGTGWIRPHGQRRGG